MGLITLPQLAEQYRPCEAKLKRFNFIGCKDLGKVYLPPVALQQPIDTIQAKVISKMRKGRTVKNVIADPGTIACENIFFSVLN